MYEYSVSSKGKLKKVHVYQAPQLTDGVVVTADRFIFVSHGQTGEGYGRMTVAKRAAHLSSSSVRCFAMPNLGEGTVLDLAVGVDAASFVALSDVAAPADGDDPLDFVVDVAMTRVLAAGEVCKPTARGRCASGTLCMLAPEVVDAGGDDDDDAGGIERWECTEVPANRCEDPEVVTVKLFEDAGALSIDPDQPQADAYRHSCTGEGTRERVLRLALPASLGPLDSLQIWTDRPEVGLALRAPGCLVSDELDCSPPSPAGSQVTIVAPDELQRKGVQPYLFVEQPEPGVLTEVVTLHLRRVLRGPPVGTP
jgi:hypothetical protein